MYFVVGYTCLKRDGVALYHFFPFWMWHYYSTRGRGRRRGFLFDKIIWMLVGGVIVHELHIKFAWYSKPRFGRREAIIIYSESK
jgi:hypothetical protein